MKVLYVILSIAIVGVTSNPTESEKHVNDFKMQVRRDNNMIGITSMAGITSRNGRVSSVGGIRFYPGPDSAKEFFYPLQYSGEKDQIYPLSVSTNKDGKYASGTVHIQPGYVSTSARAGYVPPSKKSSIHFKPSNANIERLFSDFLLQPQLELFAPRNLDNWYTKDLFLGFQPPTEGTVRNGWLIPEFNPFINFWQ